MTLLERLVQWKNEALIDEQQYQLLSAIESGRRFSVFAELNALLYLGVISFIGGLGWTIQKYFSQLGDISILVGLTGLFGFSLYYCFSKTPPFSRKEVESPNFVFDYVLYLGCLVFSVGLGFIEFRYHLLKNQWDYYLLLSSLLFFVFAYRFDNRFVLSLALTTLAGWFGIKISNNLNFASTDLRPYGIGYGLIVGAIGTFLQYLKMKRHFFGTYLYFAANVLFISLLAYVFDHRWYSVYSLALVGLCTASAIYGVRSRQFAYLVYATLYGYVGISSLILRNIGFDDFGFILFYGVISCASIIPLLLFLSRKFGRVP